MNMKRYLAILFIAIGALVTACGGEPPPPPFDQLTAQEVIDALNAAGATVQNPVADMLVGRNAPNNFSERIVFQIPSVAPEGGQIVIFRSPAELQAWQQYIDTLRADPDSRRSVIYVYVHQNALLQLNANLLPNEAERYSTAFTNIGS
jgi:hypothetical protein